MITKDKLDSQPEPGYMGNACETAAPCAKRPRFPALIGAFFALCCGLGLLGRQCLKKRRAGKRLEEEARSRAAELSEQHALTQRVLDELKIALDEAEAANSVKTAFLANTSHEMRTPLNVVVGLTDLMLEDLGPPDEIRGNLWKINNAGVTLLGIVNDILDISKIEAGKLELTPVEYETASLINDTVTLNILRIAEKPITFLLDIDENLPRRLFGDDLRVKQMLNNLLGNAFKYTEEGVVSLGVRCERGDGDDVWMDVSVSDTGPGIKPEDLKKLFSDYNQVDIRANRKIEGTGLGLSISRKLAELMGGTIAVESEYGKGSVFRVRIKQGFAGDQTIGADLAEKLRCFRYTEEKSLTSKKLTPIDLSYATVLVVDDVQTNLDVAMGLMRKYKLNVDTAISGREAINKVAHGTPVYSAIFMDHMMPGMDGVETTEKIRGLGTEYARTAPIIALTANAIAGNEKMFMDSGFQAFLSKPVDIAQLDSTLRKWVRDKSKEPDPNPELCHNGPGDAPPGEQRAIDIPGVNAGAGLAVFGGDREVYIGVLRSYAGNIGAIIDKLRDVTSETLPGYAISVHGLKGASGSVGAEELARLAGDAEEKAKSGDLEGVLAGNGGLLDEASRALNGIQAWLDGGGAGGRPALPAPDRALLARLRACCKQYDMDGIDKAMGELEGADYETGAGLAAWLREKIDEMEISEAAERLAEYGE